LGFALGDGGQKGGLDVGGLVDAGRYSVGDQFEQEVFLALRRVFEQFDQIGGLPRVQRQRGNAHGSAFGGLLAIVFEHGKTSLVMCSGARGYGRPARLDSSMGAAGTRSPMAWQAHFGMKSAAIVALKRGFWECCLAVRSLLGGGFIPFRRWSAPGTARRCCA
jgi:hypothetical protein